MAEQNEASRQKLKFEIFSTYWKFYPQGLIFRGKNTEFGHY
jgi:hypothetical protein